MFAGRWVAAVYRWSIYRLSPFLHWLFVLFRSVRKSALYSVHWPLAELLRNDRALALGPAAKGHSELRPGPAVWPRQVRSPGSASVGSPVGRHRHPPPRHPYFLVFVLDVHDLVPGKYRPWCPARSTFLNSSCGYYLCYKSFSSATM